MNLRMQIEKKIEAKYSEINILENQIREAKAYLLGLQDVLKLLPRDEMETKSIDQFLRNGSDMARTRDILIEAKVPLHINEIIEKFGRDKPQMKSLVGSLGSYVRKGEIFTRPAPNTFGLKEFSNLQLDENIEDDNSSERENEEIEEVLREEIIEEMLQEIPEEDVPW